MPVPFANEMTYRCIKADRECVLGVGCGLARRQGELMLRPLAAHALGLDLGAGIDFTRGVGLEGCREGSLVLPLHVE